MNEIKFRGTVIKRKAAVGAEANIGDVITGSLLIYDQDGIELYWIRNPIKNWAIDYPVDPDSVAQLAIINNEQKFYTGDVIIDEDGTEYTVKLVPIAENENEFVRLDTELDNRDFVLKEKKS